MPRRVTLPGASELFRDTQAAADEQSRGSGRVRHDEKITVYVSADELIALEQARLTLRARHGLAVDPGRPLRAVRPEGLGGARAAPDPHSLRL